MLELAVRRLPLTIFVLLSIFLLLTMSGHTYSADEETVIAVTQSLLTQGDVAIDAPADAPLAALRPGRDGGRYSPYGILPSLLALPFYAPALLLAPFGQPMVDYAARLSIALINVLITAATAALLARWALRLGASRALALALALVYALCTFAWPYARTFFSEPLAGLLLLFATERVHRWSERTQQAASLRGVWHAAPAPTTTMADATMHAASAWMLLLAGIASGLLVATRIAAAVALPVLVLFIVIYALRLPPLRIEWEAVSKIHRFAAIRRLLFALALWGLGLVPGLALVAWYNIARFGTPLASGYGSESDLFTTPLLVGLHGLLLSPGKSVLLYAPPLLLALPGSIALWRAERRGVVLLCWGLFASHLLLYAQWGEWQGGGVWGPRFLLPVVPLLIVLAAGLGKRQALADEPGNQGTREPGIENQHTGGRTRTERLTWKRVQWTFIVTLAALGFVANLSAVLLNVNTYLNTPTAGDKIYDLAASPLLAQWQLIGDRWGRYTSPAPVCRLGDGFYASEDATGAPLPRRSGALGQIHCQLSAPTVVSFALDDRRPPEAAPSELQVLVDGRGAPMPSGQLRSYRLYLSPGAHSIAVAARTWNPRAIGFSERDDELGPQLRDWLADGDAVPTLIDTAIAPVPTRPRPRWAWFYDPPNQHLFDHWLWYMPRVLGQNSGFRIQDSEGRSTR
jgi:4-amino-4-deoxy-L-arabinose transferase-like glycosyltransferase